MKFVYGKAAPFQRGQYLSQSDVLQMRSCLELQVREFHGDGTTDRSAKSACHEIRYLQSVLVELVIPSRRESGIPEDLVVQIDLGTRERSLTFRNSCPQRSLSTNIYFPRRHQRRPQCLSKIQQIDPSAVFELPVRFAEIRNFRLNVRFRSSRPDLRLLKGERASLDRKLRGNAHRNGNVAFGGKLHVLPIEFPNIDWRSSVSPGVERKTKFRPLHRQRRTHVVIKNPAIHQFHSLHAQIKQHLA